MPWTLLCVDEVLLTSENKADFEQQVQVWNDCFAMLNLCLNTKEMEYMTDHRESETIRVNGTNQPCAEMFWYLDSSIVTDSSLEHETTAEVNSAWKKWRMMTSDKM